MILCCYYDNSYNQHFEEFNDIESFEKEHPGITPKSHHLK